MLRAPRALPLPPLLLAALLRGPPICGAAAPPQLPTGMLGSWEAPGETQSVQGPMGPHQQNFTVTDDGVGGWYMSLLHKYGGSGGGQVFRVTGDLVQYCFLGIGPSSDPLGAPFALNSTTDATATICWRGDRLPSFPTGCAGCGCARIELSLANASALTLTMYMSPPAVHVRTTFVRTAPPPGIEYYTTMLGGLACDIDPTNTTGNIPTPPPAAFGASPPRRQLCPMADAAGAGAARWAAARVPPASVSSPDKSCGLFGRPCDFCVELNGQLFNTTVNTAMSPTLKYSVPTLPCSPCNVSWEISAPVDDGQYVAVGFKGLNAAYGTSDRYPEVPDFWGMRTSPGNSGTPTDPRYLSLEITGRIMLGYGSDAGGCVRSMRSDAFVGAPVDDPQRTPQLHNASARREGGRTVVTFTTPLTLPAAVSTKAALDWRNPGGLGAMMAMWAVGDVGGDGGCDAPVGFHNAERGLAPLFWPNHRAC